MAEEVLVVPTEVFEGCGKFQGFSCDLQRYLPLFDDEAVEYKWRTDVENDPSYKQLIPYIIVKRAGLLLTYWRGVGQGEARLHGKRSIGIGGHINPVDQQAAATSDQSRYSAGMNRELLEELAFAGPGPLAEINISQPVGLINDDSTAVGKVHLGIVHVVDVPMAVRVSANEPDICDLDWYVWTALRTVRKQFEVWSQICLDQDQRLLVSGKGTPV